MRELDISLFRYIAAWAGWPGLPCPALGRPITKLTSRRFRYFVIWPPYDEMTRLQACLSLLGGLAGSPWHPLPGCMALPMLLAAAGPAGLAYPAPRSGAL